VRSKIEKLLEDIRNKKKEIAKEYEKLKEEYGFKIK
jgi:Txe/YoeB family toxin of Txe-Axe toxin-antitoxin module